MSSSYDFIGCEKEYLEFREKAFTSPYDLGTKRIAIRVFKEIFGSSLRKLMEITGWKCGKFLDKETIYQKFDRYHFHKEVYDFLNCLIDAYNDNREYKCRKVPIKCWHKHEAKKKHLKAFLTKGAKELRLYAAIYRDDAERTWYQATRKALIIYSTILKTFFIRKLPKSIPLELYKACEAVDESFTQYYMMENNKATLTKQGRKCTARVKGGLKNSFSDEVIWNFVMYFLHLQFI